MKSYSHSALEMYSACGEKYRLWYIADPDNRPSNESFHTLVGVHTHAILEVYYRAMKEAGSARLTLADAARDYWSSFLVNADIAFIGKMLDDYRIEYARLKFRATKEYTGPNAIRTASGEVPKNLGMTQAWQQALGASGLPKRKVLLDKAAHKAGDIWQTVSFIDVFVDVSEIIENHTTALPIHEVVDVEYEFNVSVEGAQFRGFLDLIAKTQDGRLAIIDWKTNSRTHRDSYKVAHHPQLLLYGWIYERLTGTRPDLIAIGFLRSNDLVMAEYDAELAEETIGRRHRLIDGINKDVFPMASPVAFNSPCHNGKMVCPYLERCHPKYAAAVPEAAK